MGWDITKLLGPTKWTYYYLYVVLDVFSRYVVGWMLAQRELARLAEKLIAESCERQKIQPGQLAVHAGIARASDSDSAIRPRRRFPIYDRWAFGRLRSQKIVEGFA